jgi:hypothetical protein
MNYGFVAIAIAISAVVLMVVFGRAIRRFMVKRPAAMEMKEQRRQRAIKALPAAIGRFRPTTNSTATRQTRYDFRQLICPTC